MDKLWIGCASPNFRLGRGGARPEAIVIHIIVGSLRSADNTFRHPALDDPRSAHYGVGKDGSVHTYVAEENTAFHAGRRDGVTAPFVRDRPNMNPNSYTVGIEHEGFPNDPWPDAQFEASAALVAEVANRWEIPVTRERILMHREIRTSKSCPGSWLKIDRLVGRARTLAGQAVNPAVTVRVDEGYPRAVTAIARVNLRAGLPSTTAPILSVLPLGLMLTATAIVKGEKVGASTDWWCEVNSGSSYFWAGASDAALPA